MLLVDWLDGSDGLNQVIAWLNVLFQSEPEDESALNKLLILPDGNESIGDDTMLLVWLEDVDDRFFIGFENFNKLFN